MRYMVLIHSFFTVQILSSDLSKSSDGSANVGDISHFSFFLVPERVLLFYFVLLRELRDRISFRVAD